MWKSQDQVLIDFFKAQMYCPGQVAQLAGASAGHTKVVGSIPGQITYREQPMNVYISETTHRCVSPSLSLAPAFPPSL